ncbi:transketolase [Siphonobacter sp. BAB-5385]|uniref:transketolase n=1 Tax=unclassified Siphonobacter TaxID=2635712 RepID=UPI000B9E3580|nr:MULTISPECIES: transketolase [unclassified Siphonobacter]OZI06968.1 transketolase [Siphonobacter sp. BAB-5385]PMD95581.1 transketolase [Siphonobacter sp. BAB-5405]
MNLQEIASQVRRDIVRMVHGVKSGHPGGSLGCTDLLVSLYFKHMDLKTDENGQVVFNMDGNGEDLFFLSNGHISPVLYSVLAHRGYFPPAELATFRKLDSRLQGHPATAEHLPGIRIASGSLGQGLSVAIGTALGKKLNGDSHLVYVLMGDGEQQEGQIWEAATFAPHHKVDNLIAFVDFNGQQIDGPTEKVMNNRDLGAKYEAFGWTVLHMDGNDYNSLDTVLSEAKGLTGQGKPIVVITKTEMGQGVDFMMHTHKWHGTAPNDEQLAKALAQLPETLGDY